MSMRIVSAWLVPKILSTPSVKSRVALLEGRLRSPSRSNPGRKRRRSFEVRFRLKFASRFQNTRFSLGAGGGMGGEGPSLTGSGRTLGAQQIQGQMGR